MLKAVMEYYFLDDEAEARYMIANELDETDKDHIWTWYAQAHNIQY